MKDRQSQILKSTIHDFIAHAEPVGSQTLKKRYNLSYSSATIRNDLNGLAEQGYLTQVHTSSGRIPTDKGYRVFVDELMNPNLAQDVQEHLIQDEIKILGSNIEGILLKINDVMSSIVDYTTITLMPSIFQETLQTAHIVLVDLDKVLVVLMSSLGVNREYLLTINEKIDQEDLNKISKLLTNKLEGKQFAPLSQKLISDVLSGLPQYHSLIEKLVEGIADLSLAQDKVRKIMTKGEGKMLRLPEFENIEYARKVMGCLEETKVMSDILNDFISSQNKKALIGCESGEARLSDCSIVMSPYKINGQTVGGLGVLGPKRMDYERIIPMVEGITQTINTVLAKGDM